MDIHEAVGKTKATLSHVWDVAVGNPRLEDRGLKGESFSSAMKHWGPFILLTSAAFCLEKGQISMKVPLVMTAVWAAIHPLSRQASSLYFAHQHDREESAASRGATYPELKS